MIENMMISPSHARPEPLQAMHPVLPGRNNDGSTRNTNLLLDAVSRAGNTLETSYTRMMQYAENLNQQREIKPQELLVLQHRMAVHSAQLSIIKQTGEEISRGVNSIVNR